MQDDLVLYAWMADDTSGSTIKTLDGIPLVDTRLEPLNRPALIRQLRDHPGGPGALRLVACREFDTVRVVRPDLHQIVAYAGPRRVLPWSARRSSHGA